MYVLVACCPEEHVTVTRVCLLLVVQKDTWLWYSYVITVHGGCMLPRRTRDCDTCVSVACCPEGQVVVIILGNHCECWLLVTQKNTWLLHVCVCCLLSRRTRGCFDTAGGQPLLITAPICILRGSRICEPPSLYTGLSTVLGSLINEWSADVCWFGNCSSLICGKQ